MHPLVEKLEKRLVPEFRKIADRINQTIPNVSAQIEAHEVGSLTPYQGYSFWISCVFTADLLVETDNVALGVSLCHLTTIPRISAGVGWGYPSGYSEADYGDGDSSNDWTIVSDDVLEDLYKNLPRLYGALFIALKRRKPADE